MYRFFGGARLRLGLLATVSDSMTLGFRRSAAVMSGLGSCDGVGASAVTPPSAAVGLGISPILPLKVAEMGAPMSGSSAYVEGMEWSAVLIAFFEIVTFFPSLCAFL